MNIKNSVSKKGFMELLDHCLICHSNSIGQMDQYNFLYQCKKCNIVFDNPRPTLNMIKRYYSHEGQYEHWIGNLDERKLLWKRRLAVVRKYKQNGKLLDVGAGLSEKNFIDVDFSCSPIVSIDILKITRSFFHQDIYKRKKISFLEFLFKSFISYKFCPDVVYSVLRQD